MKKPWLILLLALLNGLIYVFLVPPWQHYDEPNHFEYAWLIANQSTFPQEGDFDREMRVATLQSMIEHDFFREMGSIPALDAEKPWIGPVLQVGDSPLYYWLAALPLRVLQSRSITQQLYAARMVSLLLFLATVYLGWATTGLLTPENSPLRWMAPAFLASLPAFVDIMTAVNNDVGAVAAFALFLYPATRLLVRGWRWQDVFLMIFAGGLCLLTKRTVFVTVALIPVVLLFAVLRGKRQRWAWAIAAGSAFLLLIASFRFGDAALWYRRTPQGVTTRSAVSDAPNGEYALHLHIEKDEAQYQLLQFLPIELVPTLAEKKLTLGAWMWASEPTSVHAPSIVLIGKNPPQLEQGEPRPLLSTTPQFYTWVLTFPDDPGVRGWVQFGPAIEPPAGVDIFIDGAVLVTGDLSGTSTPPQEDQWGNQPIENLLRASSGERGWVNPRAWADNLWSRVFGYSGQRWASFIMYTLRDLPGTGWYYRITGETLFRSFWAVFGWGHVRLLGSKPYRLLGGITLVLIAGGLWGLWQRRRSLPWDALLLYALSLSAIWGLTLVRGAHHVLSSFISIPVARYASPALYPTALLFSLGALTWEGVLARFLPLLRKFPGALWGIFLIALTLWSWVSVAGFYL